MGLEDYTQAATGQVLAYARTGPSDPRVLALEATVRRRDAVLGAICYAASRFLGTADWDHDIRQVLARLGTAAEVSRVYLFQGYHNERGTLCVCMQEEWLAEGIAPLDRESARQETDIASYGLGRWAMLERGAVIHGPLVTMPESEQAYFGPLGVRSLAAVPVFAGESWWGYLGFTDDVTAREWSASVLEVLQAAAATLGAAIYRRQAEETLLESEERFRRLSEAAFEGVYIHENGVLREGNAAVARIFGYELDELIGQNVFDLILTPESRELVLERIRSGSQTPYEIIGKRKDGSLVIGEITGRPAMYRGRPARVATINDITERRENEARMKAQEEELAEAQAIAKVGSWVWEIATNQLRGTEMMYRIYGFEPDFELSPGAILQKVHPDDCDLVRRTIDGAVHEGKSFSVEHRIMRTPTDVRWFHVEGRVVLDEAGHPLRIIGAGQDITERHEAEVTARHLSEEQAARAAAESAERRSAFLAEASRLLGSSFDYHTTLATLTRLAVPAVADYCTLDVVHHDGRFERVGVAHVDPGKEPLLWEVTKWVQAGMPMVWHLKRAFEEGEATLVRELTQEQVESVALNEEHRRILQAIVPRSLVCVPLLVAGKVVGALSLYTSESNRHFDDDDLALAHELARRAALAVENARLFDEAERATRARDQMLGVVAHDLRNPLSTILMASQLLNDLLEPDSVARRQVAMMHRAGERMNRLIQDLLDVKRIENGRLAVEPRPVLALSLLTEAAEMLRPLATASSLELALDGSMELPSVSADPNRVQQVFSNLIGNAIKFTPRGGRITMRGEQLASEVRMAVTDTGPGIPAEQLPHIFGQYWQGSRSDRRGIGLGLAIAKGIVEGHNGRIWVESTVGEGSSFYFTLPVATGAPNARV
jgi:PAS domain S-box-containing protein